MMAHLATGLLKECLQSFHAQERFPCFGITHPRFRDASHSLDAQQRIFSAVVVSW